MGLFSGIGDAIGSIVGGITGASAAADAAENAADVQAGMGRESIAFQRESRDLARADLDPYKKWGGNYMPLYNLMMNPANQATWLENNPLFKAAISQGNTRLKNTLGFGGMRGDLQNAITQNYMATGNQYVQQALNNMLNPIQIGQSSAAGQANTAMQAGQGISNTMEGIGNAQSAGIIAAGNRNANAFNNLLQIAGAATGAKTAGMF